MVVRGRFGATPRELNCQHDNYIRIHVCIIRSYSILLQDKMARVAAALVYIERAPRCCLLVQVIEWEGLRIFRRYSPPLRLALPLIRGRTLVES